MVELKIVTHIKLGLAPSIAKRYGTSFATWPATKPELTRTPSHGTLSTTDPSAARDHENGAIPTQDHEFQRARNDEGKVPAPPGRSHVPENAAVRKSGLQRGCVHVNPHGTLMAISQPAGVVVAHLERNPAALAHVPAGAGGSSAAPCSLRCAELLELYPAEAQGYRRACSCVILGYNSGRFVIVGPQNTLLYEKRLHHTAPVRISARASPQLEGAGFCGQENEEVTILYEDGVVCIIDGPSLYTALWSALLHVAKHPPGTPLPVLELDVRKFHLVSQKKVLDAVCLGLFSPNPLLGECNFNMIGYQRSDSDDDHDMVALGEHEDTKFYRVISAGADGTLAQYALPLHQVRSITAAVSQAAGRLSSAVYSIASSWWGGKSSQPNQEGNGGSEGNGGEGEGHEGKTSPAESAQRHCEFTDGHRIGEALVFDPTGRYVALSDSYGRVILFHARDMCALRIWKGYRDAQCAWVQLLHDTPGEAVEGVALDVNQEESPVYMLVIYAPRRGLLEVWEVPTGNREVAYDVGEGCLLTQTAPALGAPFRMSQRDKKRASSSSYTLSSGRRTRCLLLMPTGVVREVVARPSKERLERAQMRRALQLIDALQPVLHRKGANAAKRCMELHDQLFDIAASFHSPSSLLSLCFSLPEAYPLDERIRFLQLAQKLAPRNEGEQEEDVLRKLCEALFLARWCARLSAPDLMSLRYSVGHPDGLSSEEEAALVASCIPLKEEDGKLLLSSFSLHTVGTGPVAASTRASSKSHATLGGLRGAAAVKARNHRKNHQGSRSRRLGATHGADKLRIAMRFAEFSRWFGVDAALSSSDATLPSEENEEENENPVDISLQDESIILSQKPKKSVKGQGRERMLLCLRIPNVVTTWPGLLEDAAFGEFASAACEPLLLMCHWLEKSDAMAIAPELRKCCEALLSIGLATLRVMVVAWFFRLELSDAILFARYAGDACNGSVPPPDQSAARLLYLLLVQLFSEKCIGLAPVYRKCVASSTSLAHGLIFSRLLKWDGDAILKLIRARNICGASHPLQNELSVNRLKTTHAWERLIALQKVDFPFQIMNMEDILQSPLGKLFAESHHDETQTPARKLVPHLILAHQLSHFCSSPTDADALEKVVTSEDIPEILRNRLFHLWWRHRYAPVCYALVCLLSKSLRIPPRWILRKRLRIDYQQALRLLKLFVQITDMLRNALENKENTSGSHHEEEKEEKLNSKEKPTVSETVSVIPDSPKAVKNLGQPEIAPATPPRSHARQRVDAEKEKVDGKKEMEPLVQVSTKEKLYELLGEPVDNLSHALYHAPLLASEELYLLNCLIRICCCVFELELVGVDPLALFSTHQIFFRSASRAVSEISGLEQDQRVSQPAGSRLVRTLCGSSAPRDLRGKRSRFCMIVDEKDEKLAAEFACMFPGTPIPLQ